MGHAHRAERPNLTHSPSRSVRSGVLTLPALASVGGLANTLACGGDAHHENRLAGTTHGNRPMTLEDGSRK